MNTTELVDLDGAVSGLDLPWEFGSHCITMLNMSHFIMVGGIPNNNLNRSLIVNSDTFEMTRGPDLAGSGRYSHVCAHIRHNNGSNYVIAAGGMSAGQYTDTSEILDVDNVSNGWYPGMFVFD